ncbi:MAG: hypothetical protein IH624_18435 [Phycisphaerae bacterium]|nr:hypothetical protein [Phycisphaerae bacterium]
MNKTTTSELCMIVFGVLCLPIVAVQAQTRADENMLESIGKEDPFSVVRPIVEVKRNIVQRVTRSESDPQAPVVAEEIPPISIETVMLKFLQAASLEPVVSRLLSPYGHVSVDAASNTIIIADAVTHIQQVVAAIRRADRTPPQIVIEVVIVDVQLKDDTEIGVNWEHITGRGNSENYTQSLVSTLATAGTKGMDFSFIHDGIKPTIHALQRVRNVEILASPTVMVLSGQQAMIQTVEEIPYQEQSDTSAGGSLTSTQFKEVGVTLTVLAHITDDGQIKITVEPEQSVNTGVFGQSNQNSVPIVDTRRAKTTLLMNDGQVVVMGGLRSKKQRNQIDKVPLLGDLPLVGFLFSNDSITVENSELVVFLSPHIYSGGPLSDEQMKKFNELKEREHLQFPKFTRPEYEIIKKVFEPITID